MIHNQNWHATTRDVFTSLHDTPCSYRLATSA